MLLIQFIEVLQEALLVVLAQWDILAIVEEDATLRITRDTFQVNDIGAVHAQEGILR